MYLLAPKRLAPLYSGCEAQDLEPLGQSGESRHALLTSETISSETEVGGDRVSSLLGVCEWLPFLALSGLHS